MKALARTLARISEVSPAVHADAVVAAALAVLDALAIALRGKPTPMPRTKRKPVKAKTRRRRAKRSVADSSRRLRAKPGSTGASKVGRAHDRALAVGAAPAIAVAEIPPVRVAPARAAEATPQAPRQVAPGGGQAETTTVRHHGVRIEHGDIAGVVEHGGNEIVVSAKQARFIACLAAAAPHPVGRDFIAKKIWVRERVPEFADQALSDHMGRLADPLGSIGLAFKTVRGVGIALQKAGE